MAHELGAGAGRPAVTQSRDRVHPKHAIGPRLGRDDGPTGKGAPFPVGEVTLNRYGTTALVLSPAAEI